MASSASDLRLVRPAAELVPSYVAFLGELEALGETVWPLRPEAGEAAEDFVARLLRVDAATDPDAARVPQTTLWATIAATRAATTGSPQGEVVGQIGLRHRLNARLSEFGGHIGYTVRPSFRARGFAKEMLRQVLETPTARRIGRILLTCAPDNVASNRTIRANGGVLERTIFVDRIARETNLYWIVV
jgi:predicted acetyltransferase